jgi:hypothetical protein
MSRSKVISRSVESLVLSERELVSIDSILEAWNSPGILPTKGLGPGRERWLG